MERHGSKRHILIKEYRRKVISTWSSDLKHFRERFSEGERTPYTFNVTCKDGTKKFINFVPVQLSTGETLVSCEDVTESKKTEEELTLRNILFSTQQEASIDGILVVDETGRILSFNRQFVSMWGIPPEVIETRSDELTLKSVLDKLVDPEKFLHRVYRLYDHKEETSLDEVFLKDGRVFDRYSAPMFGPEARYYGRIWYFRDMTERKHAGEAVRKAEQKYRSIFENAVEGIFQTSIDERFISVNPALARMFGFASPEEMIASVVDIGSQLHVNPEDRKRLKRLLAEQGIVKGFESEVRRKDGVRFWISINARIIRDQDGAILYCEGANEDITKRKEAENALLKAHEALEDRVRERTVELEISNRKLFDIIEFLPDATFVIDKDKKVIAWNKAVEEMTGTKKEDMIGKGDYIYAIPFYGDRRPMIVDLLFYPDSEIKKMYDLVERKGNAVYVEVYLPNVHRGKGAYCWGIASLLFDKEGNIIGAIESLRDITGKKKTEEALKQSEEKYREIFENTIEGIFQTTVDGHFLSANLPLAKMLGFSSVEETMEAFTDIAYGMYVNPSDRVEFLRRTNENDTLQAFETRLYRKDRSVIWVSINARSVRNGTGAILYYEGTIENITERKEAEETIRRLAYHDALTELPNRPLFNDRLALAMSNADRKKEKVAVMLLDLDKFKDINDTLGHNVGDLLLQSVSHRLMELLRKSDTVARMGGDEFLIMIPEIEKIDYADSVAMKILENFCEPFMLDGHNIRITTSVGVAIYPRDGKDVETLVKMADIAMYEAKKMGRNDYRMYSASTETNSP
jgi:diguanylate cyclase (GGDEF)-like protein/PAS domain S-box-containing protein